MATAETRKLAAIMFTDLVGCSRQRGAVEARTRQWLEVHNRIIQQAVADQRGQIIKTAGDGFPVDCPSVVHAAPTTPRRGGMRDEPINTRKVRHARHLLLALLTQG